MTHSEECTRKYNALDEQIEMDLTIQGGVLWHVISIASTSTLSTLTC